ncbi:ParB/RepB/Spo0J family partition protein [Streptomyces javensis]|uniref:ParB/RepB/Spo0J family partition protein n=1 Tax=Streptomyces javensis TaxID=114698 RepID=A0ABS0R2S8_9ACTN|nr:ParB/RepB/Spo0J family partition protein [Streptomyces javensis]MBI0311660.1 ParB/RepB/Spo0J family partition protein [Streptomyces javensis]
MPNLNLNNTRAAAEQQRLFSKGAAEMPVADLLPSPENGRKRLRAVEGLAESFDGDGVVQALTVVTSAAYIAHYPHQREYVEKSGKPYVVLHGHRRLAAAKLKGLERVPVFIRKTVAEDASLRLSAIKENEQRLGLDPIEEGAEYQAALGELNISQRELAKRLGGVSQTAISHKIKLLKLIEPLQQAVIDHWCKQRGLDVEFGGELLLPIKEAATVLASLRPDLQQAFVDGTLSFHEAETIAKSKVPLEQQKLPSPPQPHDSEGSGDNSQGQPGTGATGGNQQEGTGRDQGGKEESGPADSGQNSLPEQRNTKTNPEQTPSPGENQKDPSPQPSPETTGADSTSGSSTGNDTGAEQSSSGSLSTITNRGVIAVTTVKDIYTDLKQQLSPEEFEELQELMLSDS